MTVSYMYNLQLRLLVYLWFTHYWETMQKAITKQKQSVWIILFMYCYNCLFCALFVSNSYYISHSQNLFHCFMPCASSVTLFVILLLLVVLQIMMSCMNHSLLECLEVRDSQSCCVAVLQIMFIVHLLLNSAFSASIKSL
jgi:hypothetical protein